MSSRRAERRRACESKTAYNTPDAASANVNRLRRSGERVHVYKCEFGNHFHVGHLPWRMRQAIAAKRRAKAS